MLKTPNEWSNSFVHEFTDVRRDEFSMARCSWLAARAVMTVVITKSSGKRSLKRGRCRVDAPRVGHETSIRVFLPVKKNLGCPQPRVETFVRFGAVAHQRG